MAKNKVIFNNTTLIDLTDSTVDSEHLATGYTAYDKTGVKINGSLDINTPEITISSSGEVSQELQPKTIYHFTSESLISLTITLASVTPQAQYHFDFISSSTRVTLILPQSVIMPNNFTVEVNTKYEIDIVNNYGVFAEWVYGGN